MVTQAQESVPEKHKCKLTIVLALSLRFKALITCSCVAGERQALDIMSKTFLQRTPDKPLNLLLASFLKRGLVQSLS